MNATPPLRILLVDDDEVDRMALVRGFSKAGVAAEFQVACDGAEALKLLRGADGTPGFPPPYIVLLDLNMPRMGGLELLSCIRADDALRATVVFAVSTSDDERDRAAAYEHHVAGYVVKKRAGHDYAALVRLIDAYWNVVAPPLD